MSAVAQGIHARWYFRATQQIKRMALIEVGPKFASLPFIAIAVWIWPQPFPAYLVMLLAHMVTAFLSVRIALHEVGPIRLSIENTAARLIKDFPVFLSFAGASLYSAANVVILGLFLPVSSVGFFGAAEKVVRVVASIVAIVPQSFFPIMIKLFLNDLGRARHLVWISSGILLVVGILCAMTMYFLSPILVQIMLGAKYNEVDGLLRSLTAVLPFLATANVFGTLGLLASGRNGVYAVVTLGAGIINVIFAVILVPIFAEQGMVFAVLGSALILALGYGTAFYFSAPAKEAGR
jgi:polysaccharide transporter, PST family